MRNVPSDTHVAFSFAFISISAWSLLLNILSLQLFVYPLLMWLSSDCEPANLIVIDDNTIEDLSSWQCFIHQQYIQDSTRAFTYFNYTSHCILDWTRCIFSVLEIRSPCNGLEPPCTLYISLLFLHCLHLFFIRPISRLLLLLPLACSGQSAHSYLRLRYNAYTPLPNLPPSSNVQFRGGRGASYLTDTSFRKAIRSSGRKLDSSFDGLLIDTTKELSRQVLPYSVRHWHCSNIHWYHY